MYQPIEVKTSDNITDGLAHLKSENNNYSDNVGVRHVGQPVSRLRLSLIRDEA